MGQQTVKVGVVDIGTNSMRLLVTDGTVVEARIVEVTGLGQGVDLTGRLGKGEMDATIDVFTRFGQIMDQSGVDRRAAIATSATRDAANRQVFVGRATAALGVEPQVIDGAREGRLAYEGAISDLDASETWLVSDIGGGSTEFVASTATLSVDIGSVRLTDRILIDRPATGRQMDEGQGLIAELFNQVDPGEATQVVGVAGTWTSLGAMDLGLREYSAVHVHHHEMTADRVDRLVGKLAGLSVTETIDAYPSLDPKRAPVILAGAMVAAGVLRHLDAGSVLVSERDSLDGLAMRTLALA